MSTRSIIAGGLLGLNASAEGPFRDGIKLFLVNYRYSTLALLSKIGVNITAEAPIPGLIVQYIPAHQKSRQFTLSVRRAESQSTLRKKIPPNGKEMVIATRNI